MGRALARMASELVERTADAPSVALIGIQRRGVELAERLAPLLEAQLHRPLLRGSLGITLYRDDLQAIGQRPVVHETRLPQAIDGATVVIVDDVLYTGRTTRAALDALIDFGRPKAIQLVVLVDRGHRELPIKADYVGKNIPTSRRENVHVRLSDTDGTDEVSVESEA